MIKVLFAIFLVNFVLYLKMRRLQYETFSRGKKTAKEGMYNEARRASSVFCFCVHAALPMPFAFIAAFSGFAELHECMVAASQQLENRATCCIAKCTVRPFLILCLVSLRLMHVYFGGDQIFCEGPAYTFSLLISS